MVDLRELRSPAQSESEEFGPSVTGRFAWSVMPSVAVPLRYQKMRFTAVQWDLPGLRRNLLTALTAYVIAGRVLVIR